MIFILGPKIYHNLPIGRLQVTAVKVILNPNFGQMVKKVDLKSPAKSKIWTEMTVLKMAAEDMNLLTRLLFWGSPPYHS